MTYRQEFLRRKAAKLGLPEDSSEQEITAFETERYREALAQQHDLPQSASWQDIADAINAEVRATLPDNFK